MLAFLQLALALYFVGTRRDHVILSLYLACVVCPYAALLALGIPFAVGPVAWWVAVWHIILAVCSTWNTLPGTQERINVLLAGLLPWGAGFSLGVIPTGFITNYKEEYWLLTGSCTIGASLTLGASLYALWRRQYGFWTWSSLIAGVWFGSSAAVNALSRWIWDGRGPEASHDAWRALNYADSYVHIICLVAWIILRADALVPVPAKR